MTVWSREEKGSSFQNSISCFPLYPIWVTCNGVRGFYNSWASAVSTCMVQTLCLTSLMRHLSNRTWVLLVMLHVAMIFGIRFWSFLCRKEKLGIHFIKALQVYTYSNGNKILDETNNLFWNLVKKKREI